PARYYRPLFLVWLWMVRMFAGVAPGWFHLAAILSHLCVVCLVFVLARRLLREDRAAVIAALLFALHPTKIEAVAWISGAGEVVHATFFLGMILAYLRWCEEPRLRWLFLSVACFAAALLAKETAIVGPVLILFYEYIRLKSLKQDLTRITRLAALFGGVVVLYTALRMHVMGGAADLNGTLSWTKTAYTVPFAFCWYLKHMFWPFGLSVFYPKMIVNGPDVLRFAGAGLLLALIIIAYWMWAKHSSEMKFVGVWFVATLLPVIAAILLLQPHDRYLYLPSFAFCVIIAKLLSGLRPQLQLTTAIALALVFAVSTVDQERYWETDRQLFTRATEIAPELPKTWELLALTYSDTERQRALDILSTAYSRTPNDARLAYILAETYYSQGRGGAAEISQAETFFRRALELCGNDRFTRAGSLYGLATIANKQHQYAKAESLLRQAIAVTPNDKGLHRSLAAVLQAEGKVIGMRKE
ncbi:MAG TPA: glycosyltransferase family 39 protein, partial [Candidatus Sulfotelmatobacter sp.]|nr:glycosyltransferase family 39 protein [Candidatus Sulfotelmatobacter sp.]